MTISDYRYRGRHRAPSTAGRTASRVAVVGCALAVPAVSTPNASADTLDEIVKCESGGNIRAQNPTSSASGKYQFIDSTWKAAGGSTKRAKDASEAEQDRVAARVFAAQGSAPWNASRSCWAGKSGALSSKHAAAAPERAPAPKASEPRVKAGKPAAQPQRAAQPAGTYRVKAGDTLARIAAEHGTTWRALYRANRGVVEDPNLIYVGERLSV